MDGMQPFENHNFHDFCSVLFVGHGCSRFFLQQRSSTKKEITENSELDNFFTLFMAIRGSIMVQFI